VANSKQRAMIVQEFFGQELVLFKNDKVLKLEDALATLSDDRKKAVLDNLKDSLVKMTEKTIFKYSIAHFLLRELFKNASSDEMKQELVESLREVAVEMLHTREGARVAMECLWAGSPKDRKIILKSFKKLVSKIVAEEHGYLVLLAAFDCVDDTKLVEKTILSELNDLEVLKHPNGMKVFQYLLSPRDPRYFHNDIVNILKAGDDNPNSKKDKEQRAAELKAEASALMLNMVKNNGKDLLKANNTALLMVEILNKTDTTKDDMKETKGGAFEVLIDMAQEEGLYFEAKGDSNQHFIEKGVTSLVLRKLIAHDKDIVKNNEVDDQNCLFSSLLVTRMSKEVLRSYVNCNKGAFLLLNLFETEIADVRSKLVLALAGINSTLSRKEYKGAQLLLQKLKAINKDD